MNKTTLYLFIGLVLICHISSSLPLDKSLEIRETNYTHGYNSYEKNYYVVFKDRYYTKHVDEEIWTEHQINYNDYDLNEYFGLSMHELNNEKIFIQNGGGPVYKLSNDSLYRIDRSRWHKTQNMSYPYILNDTLFNMGGYGYYSNFDKILYFDNETFEWYKYNTENDLLSNASNDFLIFHDREEKEIYYFGGKFDVTQKNIDKENLQYSLMKFSTTEKRWDKLGDLDFSFSNRRDYIYDYHQSILKRSFHFFDENFLYVLILNDLYTFDLRNNFFTISDFNIENINTSNKIIYNEEKKEVMYFTKFTSENYPQVVVRKIEDFIPKNYREKHYIYSTSNSGWNYTIAFFILIIITTIFYRRKIEALFIDKNLIIENDKVLFDGKEILIFDENEEKTLKYIINKTNKSGVGTDELFDIIENGSQSFDNKRKKLSIILNNINTKLRAITNIPEDMVQSIPSKEDNRLRNYKLNKKLFEK